MWLATQRMAMSHRGKAISQPWQLSWLAPSKGFTRCTHSAERQTPDLCAQLEGLLKQGLDREAKLTARLMGLTGSKPVLLQQQDEHKELLRAKVP